MADREGLLALAERVEQASGPDDALLAEIGIALGWTPVPNPTHAGGLVNRWIRPDDTVTGHEGLPRWLTSLDAAMGLVPSTERAWNVTIERNDDTWGAVVWHPLDNRPDIGPQFVSAALAITAASLRARAQMETTNAKS